MFRKTKFYIVSALLSILILTGCSLDPAYKVNNCTQKVIYDFTGGYCAQGDRKESQIVVMYQQGSPISDLQNNITSEAKYTFAKTGTEEVQYVFEGWYLDSDFQTKVDFETYRLPEKNVDSITIYANWTEIFNKYFDLYFIDEEHPEAEPTLLASVRWDMNNPFDISRVSNKNVSSDEGYQKYQQTMEEYTLIDLYKDADMLEKVTSDYVLTIDDDSKPIYTKWIKGQYKVINTIADFRNYFSRYAISFDMYLNADLDFKDQGVMSAYTLEGRKVLGNNHKISNWHYSTMKEASSIKATAILGGLFTTLTNCEVSDLVIENAIYDMEFVMSSYGNFAALAGTIADSTISNVTITGQITYSDDTETRLAKGDLQAVRISKNVYYYEKEGTTNSVTGCSVTLTGIKEEYENL